MAKKVAKRAELNMKLGRATSFPAVKHQFVKSLLKSPLQNKMAEFLPCADLRVGGFSDLLNQAIHLTTLLCPKRFTPTNLMKSR